MRMFFSSLAAAACLLAGAATAQQAYPNKPVKVVVPFAAGTSIDVVARIVLDEMRRTTGIVSVVDYRPGALGTIGMAAVAKSPPDGYTVTPASSATHSSGPQLVKNTPYDPVKDFTHLTPLVKFDLLLVVNASSNIQSIHDLVALAKSDPKAINYGYGSATSQVGASAVARALGMSAQGVPYKGQPLALNDLLASQVQFMVADTGVLYAQIKAGKLRPLGVLSDKRSSVVPDVPTLSEQGVKVELQGWVGFAGPANMPREVVAWWERYVASALDSPDVAQRLRTLGFEPMHMPGAAFNQYVASQLSTWSRHIKEAGIQPE